MLILRVFAGALVLLGATTTGRAIAALVPASSERIANEVTAGAQRDPAVVSTESGGFLVVWSDLQPGDPARHVRGRVLAADGAPTGAQFQVDDNNDYLNEEPDIARLSDGHFMVVWVRRTRSVYGTPILVGRKIDAAGVAVGPAFQLNPPQELGPEDYLGAPTVAATADGGFLVAYSLGEVITSDFNRKATVSEVYVRRFDAAVHAVGDPVMVSDPTTNVYAIDIAEIFPRIRSRASGFSVAWSIRDSYSSQYWYSRFTRLRHLTIEGAPTGVVIDVGPGGAAAPDLATTSAGHARIVWSPEERDFWPLPPTKVVGRRFDSAGAAASPTYRVAETGWAVADVAASAVDGDRMVVAWSSGKTGWVGDPSEAFDGNGFGVFAGAFEPDGRAFGPVQRINETTAGDQTDPAIAISGDTVLFAWGSTPATDEGDILVRALTVALPSCGDNDEDGRTTASDALWSLQAAVGTRPCLPCGCDVNGSGDHSATDALAVLGASVGIATDLSCPVCPATPHADFRLSTDADCSSAYAKIPRSALPETVWSPACEIHPQLANLPCTAKVEETSEGIVFEARNCDIGDRELFSCVAGEDAARAMAQAADIGCGCGCREECPQPRICTGPDAGSACSPVAALAAPVATTEVMSTAAPPAPASTATATTSISTTLIEVEPTYTTSTFCGTCCGLYDTGSLVLTSDHTVTELIVHVPGDAGPYCLWCDRGYGEPIGDDTLRFCVTDSLGIDGPTTLSQCQTNHGDVLPGQGVVVRALGLDFKPLDPAPNVEVRFE